MRGWIEKSCRSLLDLALFPIMQVNLPPSNHHRISSSSDWVLRLKYRVVYQWFRSHLGWNEVLKWLVKNYGDYTLMLTVLK